MISSIPLDVQTLYVLLVLPALFGITLVGEGVYKMFHYESGWFMTLTGMVFLAVVAFGYAYVMGMVKI